MFFVPGGGSVSFWDFWFLSLAAIVRFLRSGFKNGDRTERQKSAKNPIKKTSSSPLPAVFCFTSRRVLLLLSLTMLTLLFPPDSIENKKRMFSVHERWLLWRSRTRAATDDGELVASLFSASLSQSTGLGKTKRKNGKRRTNKKNIKALGKKKISADRPPSVGIFRVRAYGR